jgi:uroporphyrinogen decarboxylase
MNNRILSHRERLEKVISGEEPDRIPVSFWRHFPVDDQKPDSLAKEIINFQKEFDFDFVKVTPSSSFCISDWGIKDTWKGNHEGTREYESPLIVSPLDVNKFSILDPRKGSLNRQLICLELIRKGIPKSTPVLQTIFSPLSQLKNLVNRSNLPLFLRIYPEEMHHLLKVITATTIRFINECSTINIDGLFYAVQQAQYNLLSETEFIQFGVKYDQEILKAFDRYWFNILHIHGTDIMFEMVKEYPVQVINWHDRETRPTLKEAFSMTSKILCGGLSQIKTMELGDQFQIEKEALDAFQMTEGKRFILGTGCVIPVTTPLGNIRAAISVVDRLN